MSTCTCTILTNCEEGERLVAILQSAYHTHINNKADKTLEGEYKQAIRTYWKHLDNAEKLREECTHDN